MILNPDSRAGYQTFLGILVLIATACFTAGAEVSLAWDPPTNNIDGTVLSDLVGYRVYHGVQSGNYSNCIDVSNVTSVKVSNLESGRTYYFAVTALNSAGNESDFSEELILESLAPAETLPAILLSTNAATVFEGSWRNIQVSLSAPPCGVVTVSVFRVSGDTDISAVALSPLVFDSSSWMSNRFVKVMAAQDDDASNGVASVQLVSAGTSSTNLTIAERDDDTMGILISANSLSVPEGRSRSFLVKLTAQPPSSVTVAVARASGDSDITVSAGTTLLFGPTTWMNGQKVTLRAAQDSDALAGVAVVQCSSVGLAPVSLTAIEKDDDTISVELSTNELAIVEGRTAGCQIRLSARPANTTTVTVTRVSGNRYIGVVSGATLIFSRQNWSTYQAINLAAIYDPDKTNRTAYFECSPIDGWPATLVATSLDPVVITKDQTYASSVPDDGDLNGLPDAWEIYNLGGLGMLGMTAQADNDEDGVPNSSEYLAGTDPFDPLSRPFLQVARVSGQYQVSFKAVQAAGAGYVGKTRFYSLEHCNDLASGDWTVVPGENAIAGADQTVSYVGFESEGGSGFYRFKINLQ